MKYWGHGCYACPKILGEKLKVFWALAADVEGFAQKKMMAVTLTSVLNHEGPFFPQSFLPASLPLEGNWCLCSLWAFAVTRRSSPSALGHSPEHAFILFGASVGLLCVAVAAGPDGDTSSPPVGFRGAPALALQVLGAPCQPLLIQLFRSSLSFLAPPTPRGGDLFVYSDFLLGTEV